LIFTRKSTDFNTYNSYAIINSSDCQLFAGLAVFSEEAAGEALGFSNSNSSRNLLNMAELSV